MAVAVNPLELNGRLGQIDPISIDGQCALPNVVAGQIGIVGQLRVAFEVQRSVAKIRSQTRRKRSAVQLSAVRRDDYLRDAIVMLTAYQVRQQ